MVDLDIFKFMLFGMFAVVIVFLAYKSKVKLDKKYSDDKNTNSLKTVKIYNTEGKTIQTYENVYISRWEDRIYNLYTKKGGDHIIKIDLGTSMLLTTENSS